MSIPEENGLNKGKDIAIKVEGVSKTFKIPHEKISSLRGAFVSGLSGFFSKPSFKTGKSSALGYEEFDMR